jgi:hypothetical protein
MKLEKSESQEPRGDTPFEFLLKIEEVQLDLERINVAAATISFGDLSVSLWLVAVFGWICLGTAYRLPARVMLNACAFLFANLCLTCLIKFELLEEKWSPTVVYYILNLCVAEVSYHTGGLYSPAMTVLLTCPLMLENVYMFLVRSDSLFAFFCLLSFCYFCVLCLLFFCSSLFLCVLVD